MDSELFPDFIERKGSLFLRSDHMDYGRATLVSNWHQSREAEPKDYEVNDHIPAKRRLHRSTYKRIGNSESNTSSLVSTSHYQMQEALHLKDNFQPKQTRIAMTNEDNFHHILIDHSGIENPNKRNCKILPKHPKNHNKRYLDTTQKTSYQPPYPYTPKATVKDDPFEYNNSPTWKKCLSQFTDTDNYHRCGNNTWQDESGYYANKNLRANVVPKTDTIPSRLL
ncbi:protein C9orf135-like [Xenia sp. Carnegie-2017]|uniref:protein C9orf135-like n=1 Tax=Xenia sp. Carnegie-2017 TaxID=2897299 RepID=UPI001F044904|nr:protein C9orf135-like [Xenia sp. Carnegie-2017]